MSGNFLLRAEGIWKSFSGNVVLRNVDFEVRRGEVHALMGENGAGKSTLIKIITGTYAKDAGQIYWKGRPVDIDNLRACQALGIACIFQELSVIPSLTVAQNVFLGREPRRMGLIDYARMNRDAQELIQKYDFPLRASDLAGDLGVGMRQMVEILKGLSFDAELLIMDEPTASLSGKEARTLFGIIEGLREQGVSVVYISHRLEEVYRLSNRLTVLRDGENAAVLEREEIEPHKVIQLMIGRELARRDGALSRMRGVTPGAEATLRVRNIRRVGVFGPVSFDAHRGEILGIGGLIGAGRTEMARAIYGIDKFDSGEILLENSVFSPSPGKCIRAGFGFVPEDRRGEGFIPLLSVRNNVALPNYDIIGKVGPAIREREEAEMCSKAIETVDIRPADPEKQVLLLSGGNQQKVVIGKWLMRNLKVLIVDEPTAGVDVGAKNEIYGILERLARDGVTVILISSDLEELLRVSHRILVMRKGQIQREFSEGLVSQSDILEAASGLSSGEEAVV